MKLHRFFVHEKLEEGKTVSLSDPKLAHQLRKVFRLAPGNEVVLFDGSGPEFISEIKDFRDDEVVVVTKERRMGFIPEHAIHLFISITKKDNFEWVVEKCTELGVFEFTPVISDRTEKKNVDLARLESIAKEASEQSGRADIPRLNPIRSFDEVIGLGKHLAMFHLEGRDFSKSERGGIKNILIGPEGGWSDREIEAAEKNGVEIMSLGKQVLRAETAGVAVAALLLLGQKR